MPLPLEKQDIPERIIDFQVDTIAVNTNVGGYMSSDQQSVTLNYINGDEGWNDWSQSDYLLIHEQKHRDNLQNGLYAYPISSEMAYKLNMHDEISANMASLLLMRQKYLESGDISLFEKEEGGRFSFYADAIRSGKINPGSNYQEDFDKEMSLIVNGTKDMWMESFGKHLYVDQNLSHALAYGDKEGKYAAYHEENYQRAMKIAYNVGGVDFTKYINKDVDIPQAGNDELNVSTLNLSEMSNQDIAKKFNLPVFDGSMSLEQYQKLVQHKMISKEMMDLKPGDMKVLLQHQGEDHVNAMADYYDKKRRDVISRYGILINSAVDSAAKEYGQSGKELPKANDKAYQQAMDKIYTCKVDIDATNVQYHGEVNVKDLFNPQDEKLRNKLPAYSQSVKNRSSWERTMCKYFNRVGMSPAEAEDKASNLAKTNKFLGGWGCFVGGPIISAFDKIKNKFSSDGKPEKVENKPVREISKIAPKYREWKNEDGSRVSEVQYRKLPDMTKEVIAKPTKSYATEKAATVGIKEQVEERGDDNTANNISKAKMSKIIEYMNKVNGQGRAVDVEPTVEALCKKYGSHAYKLLLTAVNEPTNYAQIAGDSSIKTSRAALQHLYSADGAEEQKMTAYAKQLNGQQDNQPSAEASKDNMQQREDSPDNMQSLVTSLKNGHNRVAEMRKKLQNGHHEAARDNTYVDNTAAERMKKLRFERASRVSVGNMQPISAERLQQQLRDAYQ